MISRRFFIYLSLAGIAAALFSLFRKLSLTAQYNQLDQFSELFNKPNQSHKLNQTFSEIFISKNGTTQQNITKTINRMVGIEKLIGLNDIVILSTCLL